MWYTLEHIEIIHGWTKLAYIRMGQWVMYFNTMQIYFEKGHYFACVAFIIWAGNIWVKLAYVWVKVLKVNFPFLNWEEKTCKVAPLRDGFTIGVKNGVWSRCILESFIHSTHVNYELQAFQLVIANAMIKMYLALFELLVILHY